MKRRPPTPTDTTPLVPPSAFAFRAPLWKYSAAAAWYFVTLPRGIADQIRPQAPRVGFGSVRVQVTVGNTAWKTSVFPDKNSGSYLLPIKAAVRKAEGLQDGVAVDVFMEL